MQLNVSNHVNSEAERVWRDIFNRFGTNYSHDPVLIDLINAENNYYICMHNSGSEYLLAVFKKRTDNIVESIFTIYPFLSTGALTAESITNLLTVISDKLNVETLYFPLLYHNSSLLNILNEIPNSEIWPRLPNPMILCHNNDVSLVETARIRSGSRVLRQIRKLEHCSITARFADTEEISYIIKAIEAKSWKHQAKMDMFSRQQFEYYKTLLQSPFCNIRVLISDDRPIAYRLDYLLKNNLYLLKWSFDEEYAKFSPGLYMLTKDLENSYILKNLMTIDLVGSPDLLKATIETDRIDRFDFAWPKCETTLRLKSERLHHDRTLHENYSLKKSIRRAYEQ